MNNAGFEIEYKLTFAEKIYKLKSMYEETKDYTQMNRETLEKMTPQEIKDCVVLCIICHGKRHNKDLLKQICDTNTQWEYVNGKWLIDEKLSSIMYDKIMKEWEEQNGIFKPQ
jgi:hypothetical protein